MKLSHFETCNLKGKIYLRLARLRYKQGLQSKSIDKFRIARMFFYSFLKQERLSRGISENHSDLSAAQKQYESDKFHFLIKLAS